MSDDKIELIREALRTCTGQPIRDAADAERRQQLWHRLGELLAAQDRVADLTQHGDSVVRRGSLRSLVV